MVDEVLAGFEGVDLKIFYEGTLGAGGHAREILEAHPEIERYIGCDKDPEALALAREHLAPFRDKIDLIHGDFGSLDLHLEERGIESVDGFFLT
jgi:16S rRNA (cytosine1402-N4)-methyltransferase